MQLNPESIQKKLVDARTKLTALKQELTKDKRTFDEEKEAYSKVKILHANKKRKNLSVQTRKRTLVESRMEMEATLDAVNSLNKQILGLEAQVDLSNLLSLHGKRVTNGLTLCAQSKDQIYTKSAEFESLLGVLLNSARKLVNNSQEISSGFVHVYNGLPKKYSMRKFLEGYLEEVEDDTQDRKALTKKIHDQMMTLAKVCELIPSTSLDRLQYSTRQLSEWKRIVGTFPPNELLPLTHRSLVPTETDIARKPPEISHRVLGPEKPPPKIRKPVRMKAMFIE